MNFNIIGRSSSFKKVVTTRDLSMAYVACYVIPLDSTAPDPALPPSSLTACLLSLSSIMLWRGFVVVVVCKSVIFTIVSTQGRQMDYRST